MVLAICIKRLLDNSINKKSILSATTLKTLQVIHHNPLQRISCPKGSQEGYSRSRRYTFTHSSYFHFKCAQIYPENGIKTSNAERNLAKGAPCPRRDGKVNLGRGNSEKPNKWNYSGSKLQSLTREFAAGLLPTISFLLAVLAWTRGYK